MGMVVLLTEAKYDFAFVHLYDIVLVLQTPDQHIYLAPQGVTLSYDVGVKMSLKKCELSELNRLRWPSTSPEVSTRTPNS